MKSFTRTALLAAVGLFALSLSAHAAGSTSLTDKAQIKSTATTPYMQMARNENPGGGMYKKKKKKHKKSSQLDSSSPSMQMAARNENPGGGMYKKSKKKKKHAA
jgi:hypothetical protein